MYNMPLGLGYKLQEGGSRRGSPGSQNSLFPNVKVTGKEPVFKPATREKNGRSYSDETIP